MNFEKIKESYPKAWEKFKESIYKGSEDYPHIIEQVRTNGVFTITLGSRFRTFIDRDLIFGAGALYRFFDAQEIYIRQNWTITASEKAEKMEFFCAIWHYGKFSCTEDFPTRADAESAAFEKAFEILECKLT